VIVKSNKFTRRNWESI